MDLGQFERTPAVNLITEPPPGHVQSGVLHAISLASIVAAFSQGRATGRRLLAKLDRAETEIALLRE